ncbi:hypothetical protein MHYP_G00298090 [Metynnis hypsauchen]
MTYRVRQTCKSHLGLECFHWNPKHGLADRTRSPIINPLLKSSIYMRPVMMELVLAPLKGQPLLGSVKIHWREGRE